MLCLEKNKLYDWKHMDWKNMKKHRFNHRSKFVVLHKNKLGVFEEMLELSGFFLDKTQEKDQPVRLWVIAPSACVGKNNDWSKLQFTFVVAWSQHKPTIDFCPPPPTHNPSTDSRGGSRVLGVHANIRCLRSLSCLVQLLVFTVWSASCLDL